MGVKLDKEPTEKVMIVVTQKAATAWYRATIDNKATDIKNRFNTYVAYGIDSSMESPIAQLFLAMVESGFKRKDIFNMFRVVDGQFVISDDIEAGSSVITTAERVRVVLCE